jgi:hypothetical protein
MKQIKLYQTFRLVMNLFIIAISISACKKQSTSVAPMVTEEVTTSAKGGPGTTYPEVSLSMSVNDAGGNKITGDGLGAYVNGTQNVKVLFDKNGNFLFTTKASNNPNVPMIRFLNYNFNSPISPNPPVTGMETGSNISGGKSVSNSSYTPLQNLVVGSTQCIALSSGIINFDLKTVNFHCNWEDVINTPSAFAYITRNSATEWIISPVPPSGGCSSNSNICGFVTNNGGFVWYYNLPFSFTLTVL